MSKQNNGSTQNNDAAQPNAELVAAKERIAVLEKEQEGLQGLVSAGNAALIDAQELIKTLEAKLEEASAYGGDEALIQENTALKADNEKLKAALDGGDTREGGKEARGESMPDFLKPDYTGPVDVIKAEKIAAHRKAEADKAKGKDK